MRSEFLGRVGDVLADLDYCMVMVMVKVAVVDYVAKVMVKVAVVA